MIIEPGQKVALQFSGGRDSLALLLHMRPAWDRLTVYYCNSGQEWPETRELVNSVRDVVPSFVEVDGRVNTVQETIGWPSDVLPSGAMVDQSLIEIEGHLPLTDRYACCAMSIMVPLHERMIADGVTLILRGQRSTDSPRSALVSGSVVDGITVTYPIIDWSDEQVGDAITAAGWGVPMFYYDGLTSAPDCMLCTAWLERGALRLLRKRHPAAAREVDRRLAAIRVAVEPVFNSLMGA